MPETRRRPYVRRDETRTAAERRRANLLDRVAALGLTGHLHVRTRVSATVTTEDEAMGHGPSWDVEVQFYTREENLNLFAEDVPVGPTGDARQGAWVPIVRAEHWLDLPPKKVKALPGLLAVGGPGAVVELLMKQRK